MQLIFHGGAQEVGRSCVELRTDGDRYLLDCGLKFHQGGLDYPAKVFESQALDGVFLSHAHLDHSGGLPFFKHHQMHCPIFCTGETPELVKMLLEDSHRITQLRHEVEAFADADLKETYDDIKIAPYGTDRQHRTLQYAFFNAGHIPGSACVRVRTEGMTILYTGDYNTETTALMAPADPHAWGEVDILITEATYGDKDHLPRAGVEEEFLSTVERIVARGGRVLIPVFAVGRAQEILLLLARKEWKVPIYMDGMARKATNITCRGTSPYVLRRQTLRKMHDAVRLVKTSEQRDAAAAEPGIYVTTSGMLQGGPAMSYLEHLFLDEKSAILLTGYQVQNTRGWYLANEGTVKVEGKVYKAACEVRNFSFSAHLSMQDIQETILAVKPKILIFMHGSPDAIAHLMTWAKDHVDATAYAPSVGDQLDITPEGSSAIHLYTADDGYRFPEEHQHGKKRLPAYDDFPDDTNNANGG